MPDNLIREIAQQIVRQEILGNWVFYALILAVSVVSAALSAWVTSYIRKRAETYASKADLEELVRQLKETTEAAEKVKTAISHEDWAAREWKTLRRVKLEELLTATITLLDWLGADVQSRIRTGKGNETPNPLPDIRRAALLYFPELHDLTDALIDAYRQHCSWTSGIWQTMQGAKASGDIDEIVGEGAKILAENERLVVKTSAIVGEIHMLAPSLLQSIREG